MSSPLLIGVSARIYYPHGPVLDLGGVWTKTLHYLEQSVAHWVMSPEVLAVMIPAVESESLVKRSDLSLRGYAEALDGLLLQGGNDIAPADLWRRRRWRPSGTATACATATNST